MRVEIFDVDDKTTFKNLRKQTFIGSANFMMHNLIKAPQHTLELPLKDIEKTTGMVVLRVEEVTERLSANMAKIRIEGVGNSYKNDYFYKLLRFDGVSSFFPVYQSESIKYLKETIAWMTIEIPTATLFRDKDTTTLRMEIYQYVSSGDHKLMGYNDFTFAGITKGYSWESPCGKIIFKELEIIERFSFLDYIFGEIGRAHV